MLYVTSVLSAIRCVHFYAVVLTVFKIAQNVQAELTPADYANVSPDGVIDHSGLLCVCVCN